MEHDNKQNLADLAILKNIVSARLNEVTKLYFFMSNPSVKSISFVRENGCYQVSDIEYLGTPYEEVDTTMLTFYGITDQSIKLCKD
jgi:hypothetical protein